MNRWRGSEAYVGRSLKEQQSGATEDKLPLRMKSMHHYSTNEANGSSLNS
jgi:hypothetical protein